MKKIRYRNLDRFIEDTESFSILLEADLYWPVKLSFVVYRSFCKDWSTLEGQGGISLRYAWFELFVSKKLQMPSV